MGGAGAGAGPGWEASTPSLPRPSLPDMDSHVGLSAKPGITLGTGGAEALAPQVQSWPLQTAAPPPPQPATEEEQGLEEMPHWEAYGVLPAFWFQPLKASVGPPIYTDAVELNLMHCFFW